MVREYLGCNIKEILIDNDKIEIIFKEDNEEENECGEI